MYLYTQVYGNVHKKNKEQKRPTKNKTETVQGPLTIYACESKRAKPRNMTRKLLTQSYLYFIL